MRVPTWSPPGGRSTVVAALAVVVLFVAVATLRAIPAGSSGPASLHTDSAPTFPTPIRHVVVVYFENAELGSVLANGSYFASLAKQYAFAGQYYSVEHYSLPNYLAATSGITTNFFKVTKTSQIGDLVGNSGKTWGSFFQSMPVACDPLSSGSYDIMHNPFMMYKDVVGNPSKCDSHVTNFTAWNSDVANGKVPNYAFIVPNNTADGHDSNVSVANAWLQSWLPPLMNSTLFRTTAFFLTFDEGTTNLGINGSTGGGHVYTVAVSPYAVPGFNSSTQYDDYNLLTSTEWLLGLGHTGHNDNWSANSPMQDLFSFPNKKLHGPGLPVGPGVVGPALVATAQRRIL
ncbi:MAG: alkaline phosphatase family protein [Thermoplasmata archaeon]|nr:alkaline phosphatase family protein [Thermoplasmata archaeon]